MAWHISKICVHINAECLVQFSKPWMLQTIVAEECQIFFLMVLLPLCAVYLMIHASYLGKDICAGIFKFQFI